MEISKGRTVQWVELPRKERFEPVPNPFCGLYTIYRFNVWDEHGQGKNDALIEESPLAEGQMLALVEINLNRYRAERLPAEALRLVERIFRFFRRQHVQMIVRFLYDWKGTNLQTEPRDLNLILTHMSQLSPLMRQYEDAIYTTQGLFVGNWGEMHSSRHVSNNSLIRLYSQWSACLGPNTLMAVRSPATWRMLQRSFEPPDSRDQQAMMKLGLYNDGMLASETDFGTYGNLHKAEVHNADDKMLREYEIEFQHQLCQFVPNGGEVVQPNAINEAKRAIEELRAMRVSYLNQDYDQRVYEKWKATLMSWEKDGWKNSSAYDYIVAHLGYRFFLRSVQASPSSQKNDSLTITVKVENRGFSICYRSLSVLLQVSEPEHVNAKEFSLETDTRTWLPGKTDTLSVSIQPGDWASNSLELRLKIFDPLSGACVQLVNSFLNNASDGYCLLGMIVVE